MRPALDLRLYAILDPDRTGGCDPVALAEAAARGGATLLQLRDKGRNTRRAVALARTLLARLTPLGVPLVVDDRVDVALAAGAAGVHLGREDMAPEDARRLLGPRAVIGVTAHRPQEVDAIDPAVADYAGLGPVHPTATKDPGDPPLGPEGLARLIARLRARAPGFPVVGIAGITAANAAEVIRAGADGVAVISAIFMAEDVEAAARRLRAAVDSALEARRTSP